MLDALLTIKRKNLTRMTSPWNESQVECQIIHLCIHILKDSLQFSRSNPTNVWGNELKIASKFVKLEVFSMHSIDEITGLTNEI